MSQNCTVTPMQPLLSQEPKRPNSTVTGRPPAPLLSPAWAAGAGQRAGFCTPSRVAPCTEALYGAPSLRNTVQCQPLLQLRPLLATVSKLHAVATRCLPASVPTRSRAAGRRDYTRLPRKAVTAVPAPSLPCRRWRQLRRTPVPAVGPSPPDGCRG